MLSKSSQKLQKHTPESTLLNYRTTNFDVSNNAPSFQGGDYTASFPENPMPFVCENPEAYVVRFVYLEFTVSENCSNTFYDFK